MTDQGIADGAVAVTRLGVRYDLRISRRRTLRGALGELLRRRRPELPFWALRDVTFALGRGETLGVVGRNGAGKSTLLLAMAGILRPDEGSIRTFGRRSTLLTLGAGFDNDLTGRENIYLNGSFLGLSHKTMREEFDEIVNFAELGGFVDVPLRKYSAGMRSRLAFAIAVHIQPDLLLLDEVLGVGDIAFLEKSRRKLEELMQESHAIVAVTHNLEFLKRTCTTMLWLHEGRSVAFGDPDTVIERYVMAMRGIVDPVRNIV